MPSLYCVSKCSVQVPVTGVINHGGTACCCQPSFTHTLLSAAAAAIYKQQRRVDYLSLATAPITSSQIQVIAHTIRLDFALDKRLVLKTQLLFLTFFK